MSGCARETARVAVKASRHVIRIHPYARMRLRVEPAMTSLVIPDLIRDPVHPSARMNKRAVMFSE